MLSRCEDKMERDRLLQFLNVLLKNFKNVKRFIDAGGVRCLVDLVTLAHLHTNRATVPMQTLMLEGSAAQMSMEEAEWYDMLPPSPPHSYPQLHTGTPAHTLVDNTYTHTHTTRTSTTTSDHYPLAMLTYGICELPGF